MRTAFQFALLTALDNSSLSNMEERQPVSITYFVAENENLTSLNHIEPEGEDWKVFTEKCLKDKEQDTYKGDRSDLQFIKGKLVHNPHDVELNGAIPMTFKDSLY